MNASQTDPIDEAMLLDRRRLRQLRRSVGRAKRSGKPFDRNLDRFEKLLERSTELRRERLANLPAPVFEQDLPVLDKRDELVELIRTEPVLVVCGETGSGKSTQLPKLCLAAGRGVEGVIGHTQPRRIAARSVAGRIADELHATLGDEVGYKIRFDDETVETTYIKLMTDGILLTEAQGDPRLERYDTLIIDEAHERSLNIDFLLGMLRKLLPSRPELRVIITSATIDAERFAEHFDLRGRPAPVVEVSGRTYPVEVRHGAGDFPAGELAREVARAIEQLDAEGIGDTLAFLPTERDIRETARLLRGDLGRNGRIEVLPLYARLPSKEQQRIFSPGAKKRVTLATNVAESSLTVPRIHAVVDSGLARLSRYAPRTRVQRLPIEPISQASANQRAGRCGRVGPGVCVRLYSEADYESRAPYTTPEIRRTNLAGALLRMRSLGLGEPSDFPLLDRPRPDAVREAYATLRELQAIDEERRLTPTGERLAAMPVDPRVGRMILGGADEGCLAEVLVVAAALEVQDPREQRDGQEEAARAEHARYADARSDFVGYLNLWDRLQQLRGDSTRSGFRRACERGHLSYRRVIEWFDVHRQLVKAARQIGLKRSSLRDAYGALHRALLTGLLSGVAVRRGEKGYATHAGEGFFLWPGSAVFTQKPRWIVSAETLETSRKYLRTVARIRPEWLPRLAEHVVEREHRGARWSDRQQTVVAQERQSLFGLLIAGRKEVRYGPIAPVAAHEVFVREALAEERLEGEWGFFEHNRSVVEDLRRRDAKLRLASEAVDESTLIDFYAERVPQDVCDAQSFRRWFGREQRGGHNPLMLERPAEEAAANELAGMPDHVLVGDQQLPIEYTHERGAESDGMTVRVPRDFLPLLDAAQLEWGVPGRLVEKLVALIRTLPKPLRTRLAPAPDAAERIAERLTFGEGAFLAAAAAAMSDEAHAVITPDEFDAGALPSHLRFCFAIENSKGDVIATGRDLHALREQLGVALVHTGGRFLAESEWTREGITEWVVGELPAGVSVARGALRLQGFPALVDRGDTVDLRLLLDETEAVRTHGVGVRRLFSLRYREELEGQVRWLPDWDRLSAAARPRRAWATEVAEFVAAVALRDFSQPVRCEAAFEDLCQHGRDRIGWAVQEVTPLVTGVLTGVGRVESALATIDTTPSRTTHDESSVHLAALTPLGFLVDTPGEWLAEYPRYLRAIAERLRRVAEGGGGQDRTLAGRIAPHAERLRGALAGETLVVDPAALAKYRWMIEEYRVSVFAQKLGTSIKVSDKRLDEAWRLARFGPSD